MLKSIKWIAPILILALVGVADAKADKGKKKDKGADVKGVLLSVSRGDLQVRLGGAGEKKGAVNNGAANNAKTTIVHTDNNTTVTIDGQAGTLQGLHPGMHVSITTSNGLATSIEAKAKGGKGKKKNK